MTKEITPKCMDCKKPYDEFGMDMLLPRGQWLAINPKDDGLLCAQCIINRSALLPGAIVIHSVIEITNSTKSNSIQHEK